MREQAINEYYINLEYNRNSKEEALTEISTLSKNIQFKNVNDFPTRFLKAVSIIETNLSLFKSACEHVDTVATILEYLTNFSAKLLLGNEFDEDIDEEYNKEELILSVVLTISNISREHKVQLFLENVILKNSTLYKTQYNGLKNELSNQTNEMILLEDSDVYAVISYLRIVGHSHINKIWVQTPIKQKFLSLIKKYFRPKNLPICTWTSIEAFSSRTSCNMNIISIWSEDVGRAKYLATILDRDVIFINMHMDLYGGVMLLPWLKIVDKLHKRFKTSFNDSIQPSKNEINLSNIPSNTTFTSIHNLFYDGKWQKPVKGTYWKHNKILWASTTSDDARMCFNSAIEGLKTWKTYSVDTRISIMVQLLTTLKYYSKSLRGAENLMRSPQFNDISLLYSQNDRLEVIQNRIPRGVIILKERTEEILFVRLMKILISGNSVIVLTDANSSSLAPYCDIFSLAKVPRGVVNVLSNENTSDLEMSLCATDYANYEKQLYTSSLKKTYINLTLPKQIILSLKYNNFTDDIEHGRLICDQDRDT
ncbi:uncharacterized protein LOC112462121 isoform X1 [Temnothorax curvispinosus]|uniref:Uncharacterized protein LOC112462121 isoform X1 n=1 Tax=Temnothorax curvispinosus TaxID=300111 RepID=A0A6J1QSB4_9HYME|nr:uncharacterized protein LOC112462121 isoform X1 [Temnothorax curvispinosus]XP_024883490.1 uncharacterized protein LOC112462121 isoform X1 [Temnothorax curvispinosus]XP_024883491.1 uncharacterized protein LOC112462121 isoform X1 [Temnothorax curvispinosus]